MYCLALRWHDEFLADCVSHVVKKFSPDWHLYCSILGMRVWHVYCDAVHVRRDGRLGCILLYLL